jgi:hypothetical protein
VAIWELMPMTRPRASSSGPPELPGLIGASVWMTLSISKPSGARISRSRPETMPEVAVCSSPKGEPMATASWPTSTRSESAKGSGRSAGASSGSTRRTARSEERSEPTTCASTAGPSPSNWTCTRRALPTTWAFVSSVPSRSTTKPVPEPLPARTETTPGLAAA